MFDYGKQLSCDRERGVRRCMHVSLCLFLGQKLMTLTGPCGQQIITYQHMCV